MWRTLVDADLHGGPGHVVGEAGPLPYMQEAAS